MISTTVVTTILKMSVNLEYLFAYSIFISPRKTPVRAEAAYEVPKGIMKMNATILTTTTSAASASTLMRPEKIASNSKTHHSKHSMQAPGILILR